MPTTSATHLDGGTVTSSPTGITTASVSPTANRLQLLAISVVRGSSTQPANPSSVTGCGLTWSLAATKIDFDASGTTRGSLFLYKALGGAPTTGSVTVTFGYTAQNAAYEWDEIGGVDGVTPIVQIVPANGSSSSTATVTLAAFATTDNGTYGAIGGEQTPHASSPEGTGFTALGSASVTATVPITTITEWRVDNDTTVDGDFSGNTTWGIYGLELGAGTPVAFAETQTSTISAPNPVAEPTAFPAAVARTVTVPNPSASGTSAGNGTGSPNAQTSTITAPNPTATGGTSGSATPTSTLLTSVVPNPRQYVFVTDPANPDPTFSATVYDPTDLTTETFALQAIDLSWEEQLSEPGAGQFTVMNDMANPEPGQLVTMYLEGLPRWTMICDEFVRVRSDPGGEAQHRTTWSGPGHLAQWRSAVMFPQMAREDNMNIEPKQHDVVFDWTHHDYDDWWWVGPNWFDNNQLVNMWGTDFGAWAADFPDPDALGITTPLPDGTLTDAAEGVRYARQTVTIPDDGDYRFACGGDNTFVAFMDGAEIARLENWDNFGKTQEFQIKVTAGERVIAWKFENKPWVTGDNPTASRWSLMTMTGTVIAHSDTSAVIVGPVELGNPPPNAGEPGMTVGNAIRLMLETAQARGCLTQWSLGFTDVLDSAGQPWGPVYPNGIDFGPRLSTKILTDLLTVLREAAGTYCDIRARPDAFVLDAWNINTMNNVDCGVSFTPGTSTVLTQRGRYQLATVLIASYNDSYLESISYDAVATYGRHEAQLSLGATNAPDEAQRVLDYQVGVYSNPREEIQLSTAPTHRLTPLGPMAYRDYDLGNTGTTLASNEATVTERITAQAVQIDENGNVWSTPTLRDLFLDPLEPTS